MIDGGGGGAVSVLLRLQPQRKKKAIREELKQTLEKLNQRETAKATILST